MTLDELLSKDQVKQYFDYECDNKEVCERYDQFFDDLATLKGNNLNIIHHTFNFFHYRIKSFVWTFGKKTR